MAQEKKLTNCMEILVREAIQERLENGDIPVKGLCTCSRCLLDVEMEALNRLPSFYVAGEEDCICRTKEQRYRSEIAAAVSRAMEIVTKRGHIGE